MNRRIIALGSSIWRAAGLLAAVLSVSACVAPAPSPVPSLPSPVVSALPAPTASSSPTPTGASIPTLTPGLDAWAIYAAAWQGCPHQTTAPVVIPAAVEVPQDLIPVGDCAILFYGTSGNLWIATPAGLAKFPQSPLRADATTGYVAAILAAGPDGVWVADKTTPYRPTLTLVRPDSVVAVRLPPRTIDIGGIADTASGVLVATDVGDISDATSDVGSPGTDVLSVSSDGNVTLLWSAHDLSARAIAVDGTTTVLAAGPPNRPGFSIIANDGHGWARTEATQDPLWVTGLAASGHQIVVLSERLTPHDVADTVVTSASQDGGGTWANHETPTDASPVALLGFHAGIALAQNMLGSSPEGLAQLSATGDWIPYPAIPAQQTDWSGRTVALAQCGVWVLDTLPAPGIDRLMTHVLLPGPGC